MCMVSIALLNRELVLRFCCGLCSILHYSHLARHAVCMLHSSTIL